MQTTALEEFGPLQHDRADQQAAVAAAFDGQLVRLRHAAAHQVFGDGGEVVVAALLVFAHGGLVPAGAELAAAAQVGQHVDAAARQPGAAGGAAVARLQRHLEAAVAVQQRRVAAVGARAGGPDHEVRHARAVGAGREALLDAQPVASKKAGRDFSVRSPAGRAVPSSSESGVRKSV